MRKISKIAFFIAVTIWSATLQAQTVDKYFMDMPANLLPSLSSSLKLELMEYYKSEQRDSVQNLFGNKAKLITMDSVGNYLSLRTASNTRFEMKIFQKTDSTKMIGIINTVCSPICSSYIHFYNKDWVEVKPVRPVLTYADWISSPEQLIEGVKVPNLFKASFIELSFNADNNNIEAKNNSLDFLSDEDRAKVEPFVKKENIRLVWNDGLWKR